MPIEIKELVVRFNIEDQNNSSKSAKSDHDLPHNVYKKLVKDCVKSVMKEIERRKER